MKVRGQPKGGEVMIGPADPAFVRIVKGLFRDGDFRWIYLGESMTPRLEAENILEGAGRYEPIGRSVRDHARELRDEYIDYVGALAPDDPAHPWWGGYISEKNPYVSKTFKYICFGFSAVEWAKSVAADEQAVCFVEDAVLHKLLMEWLELAKPGAALKAVSPAPAMLMRAFTARARLAVRMLRRARAARKAFPRRHNLPDASKPLTLLFSYIFPEDFDADGNFRNHHVGDLDGYLEEAGETPVVWPRVWVDDPAERLWPRLAQCGKSVLPVESYWSVADVLKHCGRAHVSRADLGRSFPLFQGRDITPLLRRDLVKQLTDERPSINSLFFKTIGRWRRAGIQVKKIVTVFENQVTDRMLCQQVRRHFPDASVVGSQHAQLPELLLNYHISKKETGSMPLPDRIVSTGKITYGILRSSGYPEDSVREGAAFRYEKLLAGLEDSVAGRGKEGGRPVVLVAGAVEKGVSQEMIDACLKVYAGRGEFDVLLKCHPAMTFKEMFGSRKLPENILLTDEPIGELLKRADMLVYAITTVALEAVPACIPILHYVAQTELDIDPLEVAPQYRTDVFTPKELLYETMAFLKGRKSISGTPEERHNFIKSYFNPVTPETVKPYLE